MKAEDFNQKCMICNTDSTLPFCEKHEKEFPQLEELAINMRNAIKWSLQREFYINCITNSNEPRLKALNDMNEALKLYTDILCDDIKNDNATFLLDN